MGTLIFKKDYKLNLDVLNKCIQGGILNSRLGLILKGLAKSINADGMNIEELDQHDLFFRPKSEPEKVLWENLRESAKIQIKAIDKNRINGKKGGRPKKEEPVRAIPEPKKETIVRSLFIPPTLEEVLAYAAEQNAMDGVGGFACSQAEAQLFYDYYSGIGWCLPNEHSTPIRDWKPFLRKWVKNPRKYAQKTPPMNAKEIKAAENHLKLQKMLNGEL